MAFSQFLVCFSSFANSSFRLWFSAVNFWLAVVRAVPALWFSSSLRSASFFPCKYSAALRSATAARLVASSRDVCRSSLFLSGVLKLVSCPGLAVGKFGLAVE